MKIFTSLFLLELKKIIYRRNIVIFVLFFVLLLAFLQNGISEYEKLIENTIDFKESENQRIQQYILYTQYGGYGFRILFLPDYTSIIFSNSNVKEMVSNINIAERLNITDDLLGKNLSYGSEGYMNFAGIILLILSLFALFYSSDIYSREYLKFIASISRNHKKIYFILLLSKTIILNLLFLILMLGSLLYLLVNNINMFNISFVWFIAASMLTLTFFLFVGSVAANPGKSSTRVIVVFVVYFIFVFLIPLAIAKISSLKLWDMESNYRLELKKLKIVMSLEEKSLERIGLYQSGKVAPEKVKQILSEFIEGEYKKLNTYEEKVRNDLIFNKKYIQTISSFIPSAFYLSTVSEFGSTGSSNLIDFYDYTRQLKKDFFKFYINKKFYERSEPGQVESFIKGEENIYAGKSKLPDNFGFGILINIIYLIVLLFLSFFRFKKHLYVRYNGIEKLKHPVDLEKGKCRVVLTSSPEIKDVFYSYFSSCREGFPIYICHPEEIPGEFKVKDLLNCLLRLSHVSTEKIVKDFKLRELLDRRFEELGYLEKVNLLLFVCEVIEPDVIILNELEKDMPEAETEEVVGYIKTIKEKGLAILYFTRNITFGSRIFDGDLIVFPPVDHIKI